MSAAIRTPLIAAFPKMVFPALVILPGLLALAVGDAAGGIIPQRVDAATGQLTPDYNMAIPALLLHHFPPGVLGLGLTALLASFMSGMAGNVTAFNTAPRRAEELPGLVYSLTPKPRLEPLAWYARLSVLAGTALATTIVINVLLW